MIKFQDFAVYGGGSWGCAFACALASAHNKVTLYLRDKNIIEEILHNRTNSKYLSGIRLPHNICPTNDLSVLRNKEVLVIAVPSFAFLQTINILKDIGLNKSTILLIATKGLMSDPVELLSDKVKSILPNRVAFAYGPNLAGEVARNLLTSITIACDNIELANALAASIGSKNFITKTTDDIITIQIAGAVKNIIAIKSGIYEAMGHHENAKAWLITQGLNEIAMLSQAMGGKHETLLQPAVIGDLVLTCSSNNSRNKSFGYKLFNSDIPSNDDVIKDCGYLVEGAIAVKLIMNLAKRYNLHLPLIESVAERLSTVVSTVTPSNAKLCKP